jgi:hypothetical protein
VLIFLHMAEFIVCFHEALKLILVDMARVYLLHAVIFSKKLVILFWLKFIFLLFDRFFPFSP